MSDKPVMKCGHVANSELTSLGGKTYDPPLPFCAIHMTTELADVTPELAGREARCSYGQHNIVPSHKGLPFFEYTGPGSNDAEHTCKHCGMYDTAHENDTGPDYATCPGFEPRGPQKYDRYYCGCFGWD